MLFRSLPYVGLGAFLSVCVCFANMKMGEKNVGRDRSKKEVEMSMPRGTEIEYIECKQIVRQTY